MSQTDTQNPELGDFDFFEQCVVTRIDAERFELAVLHGENAADSRRTSIALGALALPDSKEACDFELSQRADQLHDRLYPVRYGRYQELTSSQADSLALGSIVHLHQHSRGRGLCVSPQIMSRTEIEETFQQLFTDRDVALRKHIAQLAETAFYARSTLEQIHPNEPYYPFEHAEIRHHEGGTEYIYVPAALLVSERWGPRRIEFIAKILPPAQPDFDPTVETLLTEQRHRYQVPAHQPYKLHGQDPSERLLKIEVVTSAPLGHQRAHEEQKLEMIVNDVAYWAEYDEEHFFLTSHDPSFEAAHAMGMFDQEDFDYLMQYEATGKPNILYSRFNPVHDEQPNVFDATEDEDKPIPTTMSYKAHMVIPYDLHLLRDICVEFPGL